MRLDNRGCSVFAAAGLAALNIGLVALSLLKSPGTKPSRTLPPRRGVSRPLASRELGLASPRLNSLRLTSPRSIARVAGARLSGVVVAGAICARGLPSWRWLRWRGFAVLPDAACSTGGLTAGAAGFAGDAMRARLAGSPRLTGARDELSLLACLVGSFSLVKVVSCRPAF